MCVCVVLSLFTYLFVGDGGLNVSSLSFSSKPVHCGAPGPTSDYPAFRGSQRLGALFTGSVEIPVFCWFLCVCVCVCARARAGTTRDYSALFTVM